MHHTITGLVIHLNHVAHGQAAGDGHLVGELGQRQPLPGPSDERCTALGKPLGGQTALRHVSQHRQLQLFGVGQQRLEMFCWTESCFQTAITNLEERRGQSVECFIGWSEDCDRSLCGEELYQVRQLQHRDEDGEISIEDEEVQDGAVVLTDLGRDLGGQAGGLCWS